MANSKKTMNDAFYETLRDVYYAEKQILRALKKSSKAAQSQELKQAFDKHHEETQTQIERLEQAFEAIGKTARAKTCEAMRGIMAEMDEDLEEFGDSEAGDAVLVGCAQAVEHYEIARYGMLKSWAMRMGMDDVAELMGQTLEEERKTDQLLTEIAEKLPPTGATEADQDDEEDEETGESTSRSTAPRRKRA